MGKIIITNLLIFVLFSLQGCRIEIGADKVSHGKIPLTISCNQKFIKLIYEDKLLVTTRELRSTERLEKYSINEYDQKGELVRTFIIEEYFC
jgi:hypothetical protein